MYPYILSLLLVTTTLTTEANTISNTRINQLPGDIVEMVYYYPNGAVLQKGYMDNGLKYGEWVTYSIEGKITAKAYYENGKKEGKWKIYDKEGNLAYKIQYRNDKKVWAQQYDDDGNTIAFNYN